MSKFLVIEEKMDSPSLLCQNTLIELGMHKIEQQGSEGTLKETNGLGIHSVEITRNLKVILDDYEEVFKGIGCIRDKNTGKEIEVKLEIDLEAIPVAQKPRNVAYHLQQPLKEWLNQGVEEKICEGPRRGTNRKLSTRISIRNS